MGSGVYWMGDKRWDMVDGRWGRELGGSRGAVYRRFIVGLLLVIGYWLLIIVEVSVEVAVGGGFVMFICMLKGLCMGRGVFGVCFGCGGRASWVLYFKGVI
jgi:hypothetical protein